MLFEPEQTHPIYWSDYSLLEADFVCMKELTKRSRKWNYFVNQAGTVMPQMDIRNIAEKISKLDGKNSIFSMPVN